MALRPAFLVLFAALALHAALDPGTLRDVMYFAIGLGAAALVAGRAIAVRRNRAAWALLAGGMVLTLAGDLTGGTAGPLFYAAMFAVVYTALALLLRSRLRPFPAWLTVDSILTGLTLAALAALAFGPVREITHDGGDTVAVMLGVVVADLLLLVVVLVTCAATNWRPGRAWWLLGGALALTALADAISIF